MKVARYANSIGGETDTHQLMWPVVRKWPQQDIVHESAHPGGGADPDPECGDNARRKGGRPPKAPNAKACVSGEIVDGDDAPRIASLLPEPLLATKAHNGRASGVDLAHATSDIFRRLHVDVKSKLLVLLDGAL